MRSVREEITRFIDPYFFPRHKHRHHYLVVFYVDGVGVVLNPEQEIRVMQTVTVGHTASLAIGIVDTNGNPMLTPPTPDSPPAWTQTTPATDTLTASADGMSAQDLAVAAGSDTITATAVIAGVTFTATLALNVQAPPQTVGGIVINVTSVS